MGLQELNGRTVYVVEFDSMPELPITGVGVEQKYAEALTQAFLRGLISKPGKYGIWIDFLSPDLKWEICTIFD